MNCSASPSWEPLLVAYVSGGSDFTTLYNAARKPLMRIVARLAPFLPVDLREDVVQQLFVRLIENPPKYDPGQCSARTLTYGLLRNAVRHVRAGFALPGEKTRRRDNRNEQSSASLFSELTAQRTTPVNDITSEEIELAPSPHWTADSTRARVQAHELLSQMPQEVGRAAWLVYAREYSITDTAIIMNKSRFAIARSLKEARQAATVELLVAKPVSHAYASHSTIGERGPLSG
jgi:RNA polymerase sigma factor (sigma-70 family)